MLKRTLILLITGGGSSTVPAGGCRRVRFDSQGLKQLPLLCSVPSFGCKQPASHRPKDPTGKQKGKGVN